MVPESQLIEAKHLNTPRLVADDTQKTVWKWEQQEPFGAGACNPDPDEGVRNFVCEAYHEV